MKERTIMPKLIPLIILAATIGALIGASFPDMNVWLRSGWAFVVGFSLTYLND